MEGFRTTETQSPNGDNKDTEKKQRGEKVRVLVSPW